ncbi:hypothetical protein B0H16DRAFT_1587663, partial [Mycena metata]
MEVRSRRPLLADFFFVFSSTYPAPPRLAFACTECDAINSLRLGALGAYYFWPWIVGMYAVSCR